MTDMLEQRASKRQQELLSFVDGFIKGNGYGPSYREVMRALDYKSVSTVAAHVDSLIAKGYLARRDKSARSLEVVSLRPTAAAGTTPNSDEAIEKMLIARINAANLTPEQLSRAAETFELLNMTEVENAIKSARETKTA